MIDSVKLKKNISFNAQSIRTKTYTVGIVTSAVILLLLIFVILPVINKITAEQGLSNDLSRNDMIIQTNLANLAKAENIFSSKVKGNTDILTMALPNTPETGPLFANLNAIASDQKVLINTIKYQKTADASFLPKNILDKIIARPGLSYLYFTLEGTGSLPQVIAFEGAVESYPRTFNLLTTTIAYAQKNAGSNSVNFNISGYVYYLSNGTK